MLKLFVLGGTTVGTTFDCRGGETLGRAPDCEVRLPDRSVSRRHARLERAGDAWTLVDLDSRNGLHVGGQRVSRVAVTDGLEVTVGELPLRFRFEEADVGAPQPSAPRVASTGPTANAGPAVPPPARPLPRSAPADDFVLEEDDDLERALGAGTRRPAERAAVTETKLKGAEARRREILAHGADGGGFLGGDLAQRPLWIQVLVGLFLVVVFAAVAFGAYAAIVSLRAS
ncbi:MAG: FHA domain-containing protein [Planctomycetota bacterium]